MLQAASTTIHSHSSPFRKVASQVCWKRTWPKTRVFKRFSSLSNKSRSALFPTSINPVCEILAILKHKKICQDECNHCKVISFKPFMLFFNLKVNTLCFEVIYIITLKRVCHTEKLMSWNPLPSDTRNACIIII